MNKILLAEINENHYSNRHLNFIDVNDKHTYIINRDKINYIEVIPFPVFNQEDKEEMHYQYLIFVGDNIFSFVSNTFEYYESLLLGVEIRKKQS